MMAASTVIGELGKVNGGSSNSNNNNNNNNHTMMHPDTVLLANSGCASPPTPTPLHGSSASPTNVVGPPSSTTPTTLLHHHHLHNNNGNGGVGGGGGGGGSNGGGLPSVLTIRMIMQGKEVGSIIGKKGDNIKKFREDSGAKINISDGSCPERIVTVTGSIDTIFKAFTMISKKFEEDLANVPTTPKPPVTLRLVMPASQCGSLIGKQGCKIKEIRESTGASIQVASEMLPNSTERAVTVSGTADAITQCIKYICGIMQESPPKGANLPYRPKPVVSPVFVSGGPPFSVQPQMTLPSQDPMKTLPPHMTVAPHPVPIIPTAQTVLPGGYVPVNGLSRVPFAPRHAAPTLITPGFLPPPLSSMSWKDQELSGMTHLQYPRHSNPTQVPPLPAGQATQEMAIPNDLIGCIIGRGGQKINEIRQVSGANIKISNAEDGSADRKVTITGTPETIGLAQYLISTSMELHKALTHVDPTSTPPATSTSLTPVHHHHHHHPATAGAPIPPQQPPAPAAHPHPAHPHHAHHPTPMAFPLQPLTMKPATVTATAAAAAATPITYISGYGPMGLVDPLATSGAPAGAVAVDRKALTTKLRVPVAAGPLKAAERPKFAPY